MDKLFKTNLWMRVLASILLAMILTSGLHPLPVTAAATAARASADFQAFFDAAIAEQMANAHIAGATVAVVQGDEIAFAKGYGYANLAEQVPVQADRTLFFIGSDGKLFT